MLKVEILAWLELQLLKPNLDQCLHVGLDLSQESLDICSAVSYGPPAIHCVALALVWGRRSSQPALAT